MRKLVLCGLLVPFVFLGQTPKIIVGIVVDQMCYDYLYRFQHHFSTDGFNRFLNRGVNCRNTNYNYVPTYTGPGHASIYTGTTPYNHGIVANELGSGFSIKSESSILVNPTIEEPSSFGRPSSIWSGVNVLAEIVV